MKRSSCLESFVYDIFRLPPIELEHQMTQNTVWQEFTCCLLIFLIILWKGERNNNNFLPHIFHKTQSIVANILTFFFKPSEHFQDRHRSEQIALGSRFFCCGFVFVHFIDRQYRRSIWVLCLLTVDFRIIQNFVF